MKGIIFVHNEKNESGLTEVLSALCESDVSVTIYSKHPSLTTLEKVGAKIYAKRGIYSPESFGDWFFLTLATPWIILIWIKRLIQQKRKGVSTLVFSSLVEKIIVTPWAKLLGYKIYWIEEAFPSQALVITLYAPLYRLFSRLATVVARSQSIADEYVDKLGVKKDSIVILPFVIDTHHISQQTSMYQTMVSQEYQMKNEALFIIGCIGELEFENGYEYLIKSIEYFKELIPHFQIIIVGNGEQKKNLHWLTKITGLDSHIRFVGNQADVIRWYNYFDLFILPRTTKTPFAFSVAHAMASKIPVVASDIAGITEIVNHQAGILVEPKNTQKLAEAIFYLYSNPDVREKFTKQAKARIDQEYSLLAVVQKLKKML